MDVKSLLIGSLAGLVVAGIPAGFMYSNLNGKLTDAKDEISQLETNLESSDTDLEQTRQELEEREQDLARRTAEIKELQKDIGTVGTCLTGVVAAFQAISEGNQADALFLLGKVETDCEKSGKILEEVEKFENSSDEITPEGLESIKTNNEVL